MANPTIIEPELSAPVKYSYKFLPEQFMEDRSVTMAFFIDGVLAGAAEFDSTDHPTVVQIHKTELTKKFRHQGHGVELYRAMFECARKVGATKIQSDDELSPNAARVWEKLSKTLPINKVGGQFQLSLRPKTRPQPRCMVCGQLCARRRFRCMRCIRAAA